MERRSEDSEDDSCATSAKVGRHYHTPHELVPLTRICDQPSGRCTAGRLRYRGISGTQLEQLQAARSVESVVLEDGWNLKTNEFGIRMALGARARDVVRMVLSGTSWNVAAGLVTCLAPARRAASIDPMEAVRHD